MLDIAPNIQKKKYKQILSYNTSKFWKKKIENDTFPF